PAAWAVDGPWPNSWAPTAPPAAAPATPAPASPSTFRRSMTPPSSRGSRRSRKDVPSLIDGELLRDYGRGDLADRLREGVDDVGQLLEVGLVQVGVELPAVAAAVLLQRRVDRRELLVEGLAQRRVLGVDDRPQRGDRRL